MIGKKVTKQVVVWYTLTGLFIAGLVYAEVKPKELTAEQQLTFQTKLTEYRYQEATVNGLIAQFESELTDRAKALRAQLAKQQAVLGTFKESLRVVCPGELIGFDKDAPECVPVKKVKEEK
jgi:hypothetical protein